MKQKVERERERERDKKKEKKNEQLWQATKCFLFVARDARQ